MGAGNSTSGGNGGSGIVMVQYVNPTQRGGGGTVTSNVSGPYTFWTHTFTGPGTFIA
jgi:hypothetical protein